MIFDPAGAKIFNEIHAKCVRPIMFCTDMPEYPYVSEGGSMFIVQLQGRCFGITCKHVFGSFELRHLTVPRATLPQKGSFDAPITRISGAHDDSEAGDIAVICFDDQIESNLFGSEFYKITDDSVGLTDSAHQLFVYSFLKEKLRIDYETGSIFTGVAKLEFRSVGLTSNDPYIRNAASTYRNMQFKSLTGISGAPVFDATINKLCGMVVRGKLHDNGSAEIWFIDIIHIIALLKSIISEPAGNAFTTFIPHR
jgi:hypothetical protein